MLRRYRATSRCMHCTAESTALWRRRLSVGAILSYRLRWNRNRIESHRARRHCGDDYRIESAALHFEQRQLGIVRPKVMACAPHSADDTTQRADDTVQIVICNAQTDTTTRSRHLRPGTGCYPTGYSSAPRRSRSASACLHAKPTIAVRQMRRAMPHHRRWPIGIHRAIVTPEPREYPSTCEYPEYREHP